MTESEKQVFDDVKYRLGYGQFIETPSGVDRVIGVSIYNGVQGELNGRWNKLSEVKPILRNKMTPKEETEYADLVKKYRMLGYAKKFPLLHYLDEHMLDYRNLIDQGLAKLDTENIYKFENDNNS